MFWVVKAKNVLNEKSYRMGGLSFNGYDRGRDIRVRVIPYSVSHSLGQ